MVIENMNNDFVETVRKAATSRGNIKSIKLPTQREFNRSDWSNYFQSNRQNRTEADERLFKAGAWFHHHSKPILEQACQTYENLFAMELTEDLLRLQIGMVNYLIMKEIKEVNKIVSDSNNFNQIEMSSFISSIENIVTSARHPIAEITKKVKQSLDSKKENTHDLCEYLKMTITLGRSYDSLKNSWEKCLWNDWYINYDYTDDCLVPWDFKKEEIYEINFLRWEALYGVSAIPEWQSLSENNKNEILALPRISALVNSHQEIHLDIHNPLISCELPQLKAVDIAISSFLKQDYYPSSLFDIPIPKIQNLTLRELIGAWRFIATMAIDVITQFPEATEKPTHDSLLYFSPVFSRTSLVVLLTRVFSFLSIDQASAILNLLTFRTLKDDPWHRPLIRIDDDRFTAIFPALDTPNLSRVISGWMGDGGLSIDSKGNEFEQFVCRELREANILFNVEVYGSTDFKIDNIGDIDLILRIGHKIIICELKCTLFPHTPHQIYSYYQNLERAAIQVKKKSCIVKKNLNLIIDTINFFPQSIEMCSVFPLIISNLHLATGYSFHDVPVVDLKILEDYIGKGVFTLSSQLSEQGVESGEEIKIYSSEEEAEEHIEQCLKDLPNIRKYRENMRRSLSPVALAGQNSSTIYQTSFDINLSTEIPVDASGL